MSAKASEGSARRLLYRRLRAARVVLGLGVLLLFHVALLAAAGWAEPLVQTLSTLQLVPSLVAVAGSGAVLAGAAVAGVLLLTWAVGRFYCSLLCPLGILQDLLLLITGRVRRGRQRPAAALRGLHFGLAAAVLALAAAGIPLLLNLLEPYALWGRILRDLTIPVVFAVSFGFSELLKEVSVFIAPVPWNGELFAALVTGFFWLILLGLVWFRGRWFCNALCPAGALLRLPASRALLSMQVSDERCITCGQCTRTCKTGCITAGSKGYHIDPARCVVCFDCAAVCPTGAITLHRGGVVQGSSRREDGGRRDALRGMIGMGGGTMALSILPFPMLRRAVKKRERAPDGSENLPATPPGSESLSRFSSRCIACHTCVSTCPTRVLQPSIFEYGFGGFMQPVMDYSRGYCEWKCVECTRVCPTDAIRPLTLERKQEIQIGEVQFLRDRCVIFSKGTACGACAEVCPTQAVFMVPYVAGLTQPAFEKELCVGCGNCEYACPVEGGKAIYVRGKRVHTTRTVKEKRQEGPLEAEPEEFPF